ncbi:hypothetical protein Tco_0332522 [Tanacetum coccineum]
MEPSISLPPKEEPTHIEIPDSCLPLRKRVRFASSTPSHEVGESSATQEKVQLTQDIEAEKGYRTRMVRRFCAQHGPQKGVTGPVMHQEKLVLVPRFWLCCCDAMAPVLHVQEFPDVFPEALAGYTTHSTSGVLYRFGTGGATPVARATILISTAPPGLGSEGAKISCICPIASKKEELNLEATSLEGTSTTKVFGALVSDIGLDLPKQILKAQTEARKQENIKREDVGGILVENSKDPKKLKMEKLEPRADGTLCLNGKSWLPCYGDFTVLDPCRVPNVRLCKVKARSSVHLGFLVQPDDTSMEWDNITMEYVTKLPKSSQGYELILVIVDSPTYNSMHFFALRDTEPMDKLASFALERGRYVWQNGGSLNPRIWRPFKVLKKVGAIAYKLELPQELSKVHNTFHVSNLKKCYSDDPLVVPLEGLEVDDKLYFVEEPVEIMDHGTQTMRRSVLSNCKVDGTLARVGLSLHGNVKNQFRHEIPLSSPDCPSSNCVC